MLHSKLSDIITTSRLLPHFTPQNVNALKTCIFDQLGCKNESEFLCKALVSLYKTMSVESTSHIKDKAIQIADSQTIKHACVTDTCSAAADVSINHTVASTNMTVRKYIQQHNDIISKLHTHDIIDHLGTFLSKQESIELGYLNKQLFVETQKYSYLLKRCNDAGLHLNDDNMLKLFWSQSEAFNFCLPTDLTVDLEHNYLHSEIEQISNLDHFFGRLNYLSCYTLNSLKYIPWKYLVGHQSRYKLSKLLISVRTNTFTVDSIINSINNFCTKSEECKHVDNNSIARYIGNLELDIIMNTKISTEKRKKYHRKICKKILMTLGSVAESIVLDNVSFKVDSIQEMQTIFHKNLKKLYLSDCATIEINNQIINDLKKKHVNAVEIGQLQTIDIHLYGNESDELIIEHFKCLDIFCIRRCITYYTISWYPKCKYFTSNNMQTDDSFRVFDKIFLQDYDKHPLLEKIVIRFSDEPDLSGFARLLVYFHQLYNQLFAQRKRCLQYFERIEIVFRGIPAKMQEYAPVNNGFYLDHELIFAQSSNQKYPIDDKTIEIKNINIYQFGIIYQNVFKWLKSIQAQSSDNTRFDEYRVVLFTQ